MFTSIPVYLWCHLFSQLYASEADELICSLSMVSKELFEFFRIYITNSIAKILSKLHDRVILKLSMNQSIQPILRSLRSNQFIQLSDKYIAKADVELYKEVRKLLRVRLDFMIETVKQQLKTSSLGWEYNSNKDRLDVMIANMKRCGFE